MKCVSKSSARISSWSKLDALGVNESRKQNNLTIIYFKSYNGTSLIMACCNDCGTLFDTKDVLNSMTTAEILYVEYLRDVPQTFPNE